MGKDKVITTRSVKHRRWYCTTCDTFTNSYNQFNQHLEGVGHRHKIMTKNNRKNNVMYQDEEEYNIYFYVVAFIQVVIITFILFYFVVKISNN